MKSKRRSRSEHHDLLNVKLHLRLRDPRMETRTASAHQQRPPRFDRRTSCIVLVKHLKCVATLPSEITVS